VKLLLARHGQTEWNARRRFQGASDVGLSDLGRRQAEALGRAIRSRALASVYTSPLRRAVETTEIALRGRDVRVTVLPELIELGLGEWEGCTEHLVGAAG
jgi:broad specificity phosphatase PhoE